MNASTTSGFNPKCKAEDGNMCRDASEAGATKLRTAGATKSPPAMMPSDDGPGYPIFELQNTFVMSFVEVIKLSRNNAMLI